MSNRKSTVAVLSIALLGLTACEHYRWLGEPGSSPGAARKDCSHPGLCEVDVDLNGCSPIAVDIKVSATGAAQEVRWKAPNGYVFTSDGIRFDASPVIDMRPGIQGHGDGWMVVDRPNGAKVISKYRIQLKATSVLGTICTGPDPVIVND